jgi:hypothetical protein
MLRYLKDAPTAFDPETISILSGALDDAWQAVEANKTVFRIDGHPEAARNALAKHDGVGAHPATLRRSVVAAKFQGRSSSSLWIARNNRSTGF